jgi:hypothetical protein
MKIVNSAPFIADAVARTRLQLAGNLFEHPLTRIILWEPPVVPRSRRQHLLRRQQLQKSRFLRPSETLSRSIVRRLSICGSGARLSPRCFLGAGCDHPNGIGTLCAGKQCPSPAIYYLGSEAKIQPGYWPVECFIIDKIPAAIADLNRAIARES